MNSSRISVIIPTRNHSNSLKKTVASVISRTISPEEFEVLIIDNGSTDDTKEVVEKLIKENSKYTIRYIYEPIPGLLSGRHRGALEAKGNILVYIDDDVEADKNWLQAIKDTFEKYPNAQLVGGKNLPKFEVDPPEWILRMWNKNKTYKILSDLSILDLGDEEKEVSPLYVWGLNFSIRKSTLFELGGFHPDGYPKHLLYFRGDGETGLALKAMEKGLKAIYQPKALVYHIIPSDRLTIEYFEMRHFIQGISDSYTAIRKRYGKYKSKNSLREEIKTLLRSIRWKIRTNILKLSRKEEDKLMLRFSQAWLKGYNFHQNMVRENPELLKWVLRDNYFDYRLPKL